MIAIARMLVSLILLPALVLPTGCSGGSTTTAPSTGSPQAGLPVIPVRLTDSTGAVHIVNAEVASTPAQHEIGLMNRSSMPADSGMLFVFSNESVKSFWMKNTLIPLDMLFIDSQKKIIDINKSATPLSETPYASSGPAKYVLEVNGGYCDGNNIKVGDSVSFDGY